MPMPLELFLLVAALILTAAEVIQSPRNFLAWAVLCLVVLALYPHVV